jgi:Immunoglobulin I-set domain
MQDGEPVDLSDSRISADSESGLLTISSLSVMDEGKYLCMAGNSVGKATAERTVKVHSRSLASLYSRDDISK